MCNAQGAGKGIRTCTDLYGLVRTLLRRRLRRASGTGLCGGYALRKFQNTWLAGAEHSCAFSNTRGEALRCRARRGRVAPAGMLRYFHFVSVPGLLRRAKRRREAREGASPTADHMAAAPCRHRALSRLLTAAGDGASASNLKKPHCVPQASIQHTGEKGEGDTGKSKVSPRAPCAVRSPKNIAHSLWLAKHIAQCTGWEQRNHEYCEYREYCKWSMAACVPCALEFR